MLILALNEIGRMPSGAPRDLSARHVREALTRYRGLLTQQLDEASKFESVQRDHLE